MPKLILTTEAQGKVASEFAEGSSIDAKPARLTAARAGFGNASPFRREAIARDPMRLAVLGVGAIGALTFLGSMIAVLLMRAP